LGVRLIRGLFFSRNPLQFVILLDVRLISNACKLCGPRMTS